MSSSQSKNFQKFPIGNFIEYGDNFTKENAEAFMDVLRHDSKFFETLAHAVDGMTGMSMGPPIQERKTMELELPVVEKLIDGNVLTIKVTAPPSGRGFCKEDVNVFVEKGGLVIDIQQKEGVKMLLSNNNNPPYSCKLKEIKAEISNGVLTVVCPKKFKRGGPVEDVGVHHVEVNCK